MTPAEGPLLLDLQFPGVVGVRAGLRTEDSAPVADLDGLRSLADRPPRTATEACRLGALLARTVAEVHRAGVVHGRLADDAVLVDDDGRPVLRGFGAARRSDRSAGDTSRDGDDLRRLLLSVATGLGRAPDGPEARRRRHLVRTLRRADGLAAVDLSDRLAVLLRRLDADAPATEAPTADADRLAGLDRPTTLAAERSLRARVRARPTGPSRASLVGLAGGTVVVVALALGLLLRSGPGSPPIGPTVVDPTGTPGAPEVAVAGFAYRVGLPGDVAVVRDCAGVPSVWLLRPSTGALYRFDDLAGADPVATAPLRYAPGATGLSVHRVLDCDHVHLELPGHGHLEVAG